MNNYFSVVKREGGQPYAVAFMAILVVAVWTAWAGNQTDTNKIAGNASEYELVPWVLPVMFPQSASPSHKASAERLSKSLGQEVASPAVKNPVCCFWIEIDHWLPNPGQPGYVIILQKGGAVVRATDEEQLERAVAQIDSLRQVVAGKVLLPTNVLLSSYPVVQTEMGQAPSAPPSKHK